MKQRFAGAATLLAVIAFATRWSFRSRFLYSWDSANFAFAVEHIDIAAHRPHPPGYLGYVFAARILNLFTADANAALVLWNLIVTALAVVLLMRLACVLTERGPASHFWMIAAGILLSTSPLLWFYSEVAEIYPSELFVTLLVAYGSIRAWQRKAGSLYLLAVAIPLAAFFKLTAALLMLPLALYGWYRSAAGERRAAAITLLCLTTIVVVVFLSFAPDLPRLVVQQFTSNVSPSQLAPADPHAFFKRINRNGRDTLLAGLAMMGILNFAGLFAWAVTDRRLPAGLTWRIVLLWAAPWFCLCLFVHIAKPGYLLPVLPVATLVVASYYSRLRPLVGRTLLVIQVAANVSQFALLRPMGLEQSGDLKLYRDKSVVEQLLSDAQPLTMTTAAAIRQSDASLLLLRAFVAASCASGDPILIADLEPIDPRRLTYYFPDATVVSVRGATVTSLWRRGTLMPIPESELRLPARCKPAWLKADGDVPPMPLPGGTTRIQGLGYIIPATNVTVINAAISF